MLIEHVDGAVRDKAHAEAILAAMRLVLPAGTGIRITPKSIKLDMSRSKRYDNVTAELVKVGGQEPAP